MKKIIILAIMIVIAAGPLFKGLFFPFEMYISFAAITIPCVLYCTLKIIRNEEFYFKRFSVYAGALLILAYILSFINAVNVRGNIESLLQLLVYFLIFMVVYDFFKDNRGQVSLFPQLSDTMNGDRIGSTLQYANTAAIYFLVMILLIIPLIINLKNIFIKAVLSGVGNVLMMALFFHKLARSVSGPSADRLYCAYYYNAERQQDKMSFIYALRVAPDFSRNERFQRQFSYNESGVRLKMAIAFSGNIRYRNTAGKLALSD